MKSKIIVVDLECTCDQRMKEGDSFIPKVKRDEMEIIEIGAVIADLEGNVYEKFSQFIKPVINPELTDFCKDLTKISQGEVDNGCSLSEGIRLLSDWAKRNNVIMWGSWGWFDKNKIKKETEQKNIAVDNLFFFDLPYINISHEYMKEKSLSRKIGLGKALNREKMVFEGVKHRAVYDALNTSKLLKCLTKDLRDIVIKNKFEDLLNEQKKLPPDCEKILCENIKDLYI